MKNDDYCHALLIICKYPYGRLTSVFKHSVSKGWKRSFFGPDVNVDHIKSCRPALFLTHLKVEICFVCVTTDFPKKTKLLL